MPDLNIDLGELPNEPVELYSLAHRVNVACGGHAGDDASMRAACLAAKRTSTIVGAHPSYPDRANFGRIALPLAGEALQATIREQCSALRHIAEMLGVRVIHVKPHGALYHSANRDPLLARDVCEAARDALGSFALLGPPEGALREAARAAGLHFHAEGFADRGYAPDGTLLPRGTPGALLGDPAAAAAQARTLAVSGRFETLCVHSDTPNAIEIARAVRQTLDHL